MNPISFPMVITKNIGREKYKKWQNFYKVRIGHKDCWKEEGLWRRTQREVNKEESGWKSEDDKRRRMIHYEHEFDVIKQGNVYNFCLIKTYVWIHLCLPNNEMSQYINGIARLSSNWRKISSKNNIEIFNNGQLSLKIQKSKRHARDIEEKRSFPNNYAILEITLYSEDNDKDVKFLDKPWFVLKSGVREKDKRGNPLITDNVGVITPYLPAQVELGGGASIELGVYPLNFLHKIYSISDKNMKFVFNFKNDKLIRNIVADPEATLKDFSLMHEKIIYAKTYPFYDTIRCLYDKGFFVGPVITDNFDGLVRQVGLKEVNIRRYDEIHPKIVFDGRAKSLVVIGVHADRRAVQKSARKKGLKVIYIDPEGYQDKNIFLAYPLESPQDGDIVIHKTASAAVRQLNRIESKNFL